MATPSYASSTELDAVNSILMSVGETPVNTLTTQSPEVAIAQSTLRQVCREVQSEGWVYNTEYEVPFTVNSNDEVVIPPAALQVDVNKYKHTDTYDVSRREGKLYDRYNHTFKFTDEDILYVDVVWFYEFDDIPQAFRDYITARAARQAAGRMVSDADTIKILQIDEVNARANAIEYDTQQGDYNMFNDARLRSPYTAYKPFQALKR